MSNASFHTLPITREAEALLAHERLHLFFSPNEVHSEWVFITETKREIQDNEADYTQSKRPGTQIQW